jgi:lambda family phage portal protein
VAKRAAKASGVGKAHADSSGLEAGRYSRRLSGWVPSRVHVNTLIQLSGGTTLARARYLSRNNGYATNAVECFSSNLVGAGIIPSWNPPKVKEGEKPNTDLKAEIQELWNDWTDDADADGVTDLYGLERRIGRELFIAGECFVRLRPRYLSDGLAVPLQLQVLPSEMLPISLTLPAQYGNQIRQGIEFDAIGRRVAYHFWKVNPGDTTTQPQSGETTRVPAEMVLHVYDPVEGGQIRGLSKLTPAIVPLWSLDSYDDAELERKKTAALFSLFITRPDPDGVFIEKAAEDAAKADGTGTAIVTLEAGTSQVLNPGEDIKVAAPADVGNSYEAFQYRQLTRICAGLGLPYVGVTGDLRQASYANSRAALVESRRRCEALQHNVMVFQFCRVVWKWFIDQAVLANKLVLPGYVKNPKPYQRVTWIPPRWEWVDPLKDRQAEALAVDNGFKARSAVIEAEGGDPIEVDNRIAEDQRRARELGIVLQATHSPNSQIAQTPPEETPPVQPPDQIPAVDNGQQSQ